MSNLTATEILESQNKNSEIIRKYNCKKFLFFRKFHDLVRAKKYNKKQLT